MNTEQPLSLFLSFIYVVKIKENSYILHVLLFSFVNYFGIIFEKACDKTKFVLPFIPKQLCNYKCIKISIISKLNTKIHVGSFLIPTACEGG